MRPRGGGRSPLAYLRSLTALDGSVRYARTSGQTPAWVTAQAAVALARRTFPLAPVPRARRAARTHLPARRAPRRPAVVAARRPGDPARRGTPARAARPARIEPPEVLALARGAGALVGLAALALDGPSGTPSR